MAQRGKCAHCGSGFVTHTALCAKCGTGFPLCKNDLSIWKTQKCPKCGTIWANWNILSLSGGSTSTIAAGSSVSDNIPTGGLSLEQIWQKKKVARDKKRAEDGPTKHRGIELDATDVQAIREIEDAVQRELPLEKDASKAQFAGIKVQNNKIVELGIFGAEIRGDKLASIGKLTALKKLVIGRGEYGLTIRHISEKIADCSNLEAASLGGISLDVFPPLPRSVKKLRVTNWDWNTQFSLLADVLKLDQLEELNLQGNFLNADVFANGIGNLKNLKKLSIAGTKGLGKFPDSLQNLKALEELDVTGSDVTNAAMCWSKWFENMNLKFIHGKKDQVSGMSFGNVRKALEKNNPSVYPKLGFKDKLKSGLQNVAAQAEQDPEAKWRASLPEPLKKGWSGIK